MSEPPGIDPRRVECRIRETLGANPEAPWFVAYSGGLDSTVLLHLLAGIAGDAGARLVALHADHGLSPRSPQWREACQRQCREWGIEYRATRLALDPARGAGPEARARDARYRWFREVSGGAGCLFTAHHRGDQAETVIERLSRGAGPRGLRGIRPSTRLYGMKVMRPLLDIPRASIRAYAEQSGLRWVTDESNTDTRFTRNYIRLQVLPALAQRWPAIETALARTASAMADAQCLLDEMAAADLEALDERTIRGEPCLDVAALRALSAERRRNVLRNWIRGQAGVGLSFRRLHRLSRAVAEHPGDPGGLRWPPLEFRFHRGRLYSLRPWPPCPGPTPWQPREDLRLANGVTLRARAAVGRGLQAARARDGVRVVFRRGGEKCRLPGRARRHTLKQVFQDAGVPPWQRGRIPLLDIDGEIAAIAGLTPCEPFIAREGEPGLVIEAHYA